MANPFFISLPGLPAYPLPVRPDTQVIPLRSGLVCHIPVSCNGDGTRPYARTGP